MNCGCASSSSASGAGRFFSKNSRRYLKTFRKKGLAKEQRYLADGIASRPLEGATLLEIGCGVGGLHLSLLRRGAASAVGVDAAEGMIANAKLLARELTLETRVEYIVGDFVARQGEVPSADVTILDKVVCCYENVDELVRASVGKTRKVYALSFPRPNFMVQLIMGVPITLGKLLRWSFRPYWHDWEKLVASIERDGFRQMYANSTLMWSVRVFERAA